MRILTTRARSEVTDSRGQAEGVSASYAKRVELAALAELETERFRDAVAAKKTELSKRRKWFPWRILFVRT